MSVVEVEKKGALAFFTLNRPDKFNAVNPAMVEALNQTMMEFMEDDSLRVGIITGKGEKAFCSGADVVEWLPYVKETADRPWRIPPILTRGQYVTKPLIAAVNGIAFGLGGEIAMACDLRIAADTATFRWPEPRLGILPRMGGTQRLPRLVGYGRAMEILLTNEKLDAQTALRDGLVNKVVPKQDLMAAAEEMAAKICALAPLAVKNIKRCIAEGTERSLEDGLALENRLGMELYATEDYIEGSSAFKEKREPHFQGK